MIGIWFNVIMHSVIMLNVVMHSFIRLCGLMLSVIMLNVILLNVMAPDKKHGDRREEGHARLVIQEHMAGPASLHNATLNDT